MSRLKRLSFDGNDSSNDTPSKISKIALLGDVDGKSDKIVCKFCKLNFSSLPSLGKHIKRLHADKMDDCIKCPQCNDRFFSSSGLNRHLAISHGELPITPEVLKESQNGNGVLNLSLGNGFDTDIKPVLNEQKHTCCFCPKLFGRYSDLRRHIMKHHDDVDPVIQCDKCDMKFYSVLQSSNHMWNVHKVEPKNGVKVEVNDDLGSSDGEDSTNAPLSQLNGNEDKDFKGQTNSNDQIRYPCSECSVTFCQASGVRKHIKRFHPETVDDSLKCRYCRKVYFSPAFLSTHESTCNGDQESTCNGNDESILDLSNKPTTLLGPHLPEESSSTESLDLRSKRHTEIPSSLNFSPQRSPPRVQPSPDIIEAPQPALNTASIQCPNCQYHISLALNAK